jgi:hypothetical protein
MNEKTIIPSEVIEKRIFIIRGQKVIPDFHIAELYKVETKVLKRVVKRNRDRFPNDFCFELTTEESQHLRYQIGTSRWGGTRYRSIVFTEQGIAMLSSVLNSKRAIRVNVEIMRTFVKLREILLTHKDLAAKLEELEKKYDAQFRVVFDAIRQLMTPPDKPKREIACPPKFCYT